MKPSVISRLLPALVVVLILASASRAEVLKIVVNDTIQPITEEYISRAIDEAQRRNDQDDQHHRQSCEESQPAVRLFSRRRYGKHRLGHKTSN